MARKLGKALAILGAFGFAVATAWWYAFFEQMLGADVKQASECFYFRTFECDLGRAAGVFGDVPAYEPAAFWLSAGTAAIGVLVWALAPDRDARAN